MDIGNSDRHLRHCQLDLGIEHHHDGEDPRLLHSCLDRFLLSVRLCAVFAIGVFVVGKYPLLISMSAPQLKYVVIIMAATCRLSVEKKKATKRS